MSRPVKIALTVEEWGLVRAVLQLGFVRDPHPNWLSAAGANHRATHAKNVRDADVIVGKIEQRFGL